MEFSTNLQDNIDYLHKKLNVQNNFDVVSRPLHIGGRTACLYFIDGFAKDETLLKILQVFSTIKEEDMPGDAHGFTKRYVPYGEVGLIKKDDDMIVQLLSGVSCLLIDGYDTCIAIDARTYPARGVSEPEKDKVMRGSRDGFVETLVFNTALIRRRIRDPRLTMEIMTAGESSHTDIAICYMQNRVDQPLLEMIKKRIQNLKVDALTMNQESLAECLYPHKWFNPFPKFKFSERPDTAAASVLEGDILLMIDNTPAVMLLPCSLFRFLEEVNDYYFPPLVGTYLRIVRVIVLLLTLFVTPLWYLLVKSPDTLRQSLHFLLIEDEYYVPLILQLLLVEFIIDVLKLASLNTPDVLSNSFSMLGALILGDFAVQARWLVPEVLVYMAFVAIANYAQHSYEMGYAVKLCRMVLLLLIWLFDWWGFIGGILGILALIASTRPLIGKGYLYPLIPFNGKDLWALLHHRPIDRNNS